MKAILPVIAALLGAGCIVTLGLAFWHKRPVEDDEYITGGHV